MLNNLNAFKQINLKSF